MTPSDAGRRVTRLRAVPWLAAIGLLAGCGSRDAGQAAPAAAPAKPIVPKAAPAAPASRVLGKDALTLRGKPACRVRFVYAGRPAEDLIWEEACPAVTARMMTEPQLAALGRWDRLDSFARDFVHKLPGGRVLYVEGGFSASVYPVGTTGSTYEVPVTD